jgi:dihydrofolate reductase
MGKVVVMNHLTLDGVMQGPGRADEDPRDGFAHGGWAVPGGGDEAIVTKMGERMGGDRAFLFGRRTYEDLLASWNAQGGPFKDALNNARKYVASHNPAARLARGLRNSLRAGRSGLSSPVFYDAALAACATRTGSSLGACTH